MGTVGAEGSTSVKAVTVTSYRCPGSKPLIRQPWLIVEGRLQRLEWLRLVPQGGILHPQCQPEGQREHWSSSSSL